MLTPEMWGLVAEWAADLIRPGAWVIVADESGHSAVASVSAVEVEELEGGGFRVRSEATFPEDEANFEWLKHSIKLADGTIIDREVNDLGRKAQGSEWEIEVGIDFGVPA